MKEEKAYYNKLNIIRILSCIGVFLYHLNILKGGYLAVCTFFVLTGYLSIVSASKKEKFSLKNYYFSRLKQIYYPLLIVVFLSISMVLLLMNFNWINLKPETISVLTGTNNFWQLNANLDYFTRHVSSPFIHLWYISILLQFDLVFPIIYIILNKVKEKTHKIVPLLILLIGTITSTLFVYLFSKNTNTMVIYYNTFYRLYSIIFGLLLGYLSINYKSLIPNMIKKSFIKEIIFYLYLSIYLLLMITVKSNAKYFLETMILVTILSCRIIDYATIKESKKSKLLKFFSDNTYEIYLVQYPIIFFFQDLKIENNLKVLLIISITIVISILLKLILHIKIKKGKIIIWILRIPILLICFYGLYQFVITKDYTQEMKELEKQLAKNEEVMKVQQEEYAKRMKEQSDSWDSKIEEFMKNEEQLKEAVRNLNIVGVGDSVMLGAIPALKEQFPNGYFDAGVSRTDWEANNILISMKNQGILGEPILINLGTNGQCGENCRNDILRTAENRKIFWVNVTNDNEVHVNSSLEKFASEHDNVYLIDWNQASLGHREYFVADGIHLTSSGMKQYSETVYNSIYDIYYKELELEKEKLLKERENETKNKISFYGNDLLLNISNDLKTIYQNDEFYINKNYSFNQLKEELQERKQKDTIPNTIVFIFDESLSLKEKNYKDLLSYLDNKIIYIIQIKKELIHVNNPNITILPFYKEIDDNDFSPDKIHLSNKGNKKLKDYIIKTVKNSR